VKHNHDIIILAAGSSGRLGQPKQLLPWKNSTLLNHLVNEAKNSAAGHVIVVLGAHADSIKLVLANSSIEIVVNDNWSEGMASSIRYGVDHLQKINPAADTVTLMTCDQPHVTTILLDQLIETHLQSGKLIVSSKYTGSTGPPVLFHKIHFNALLALQGDSGARKIVQQYPHDLAFVSFPAGEIDIDTEEDYQSLLPGAGE
jgi:molybdenum cofactor cytidylyltransferase